MAHLSSGTRRFVSLSISRFAGIKLHFSTNEDVEYLKSLVNKPIDKSGDHPFGVQKSPIPVFVGQEGSRNTAGGSYIPKNNNDKKYEKPFQKSYIRNSEPQEKWLNGDRKQRLEATEENGDTELNNEDKAYHIDDVVPATRRSAPTTSRRELVKMQNNSENFEPHIIERRSNNNRKYSERLESTEVVRDDELIDDDNADRFDDMEPMSRRRTTPTVVKHDSDYKEMPLKTKSYSMVPLINKSKTLRKLVDLGVDLSQLEVKYNAVDFVMRLNWEIEALPRLRILLSHACVDEEVLGNYITKNPWFFQQDIDDLQTRVNYLESKGFSKAAIARIVTHAAYWLNISVPKIDSRLNWYVDEFRLKDDELRFIVTKNPKLITMGTGYVQLLQFSFEEEMGFSKKETKTLLLKDPKLWTSYKEIISKTFDFLHNKLGITHQLLLAYPRALRVYKNHIEERHEFLKKRSLNQYDPEKPNFVPLYALVGGTDEDFCRNIAKCSVKEYNIHLKSR